MAERSVRIEELADRAGVTVRTVRYYISQGLLPGPGARGKGASYTDEHLARLRLIRRLVEQHVPLAEQRARLAGLSSADVRALLHREEQREASLERAETAPSPRAYVAALLDRAHTARADAPRARGPQPSPADAVTASPPPLRALRRLRAPSAEPWQRWELAPGLELHARADAARRHAELIARLLADAAGSVDLSAGHDPGSPGAAFTSGDTLP